MESAPGELAAKRAYYATLFSITIPFSFISCQQNIHICRLYIKKERPKALFSDFIMGSGGYHRFRFFARFTASICACLYLPEAIFRKSR